MSELETACPYPDCRAPAGKRCIGRPDSHALRLAAYLADSIDAALVLVGIDAELARRRLAEALAAYRAARPLNG